MTRLWIQLLPLVLLLSACPDPEPGVLDLPGPDAAADSDGDGVSVEDGDCDDSDSSVFPGADEAPADNLDSNCDGQEVCFTDADDDGFRPGEEETVDSDDLDCDDEGEATALDPTGDCNDDASAIYPGAPELCDTIDSDCDGSLVDEDIDTDGDLEPDCTDLDDDGDGDLDTSDCAPLDPAIYNGAAELCNQADDNCNGAADEGLSGIDTWYLDGDDDSYGVSTNTDDSCAMPPGYAALPGDCDDGDPTINPLATETCDGVDEDCDGETDEGLLGMSAACPAVDCFQLTTLVPSTASGTFWLHPTTSLVSFEATCDMTNDGGGWTVIDPSMASEWTSLFLEWNAVHSTAASPSTWVSGWSWREWFGEADSSTEFRRSSDCVSAEGASEGVYRMTGNYYGCFWYNRNCDMDSSGNCSTCYDNYGQWISGACTHIDGSPDSDYYHGANSWGCANHWWNSGPSLGTNGTYCVAYR